LHDVKWCLLPCEFAASARAHAISCQFGAHDAATSCRCGGLGSTVEGWALLTAVAVEHCGVARATCFARRLRLPVQALGGYHFIIVRLSSLVHTRHIDIVKLQAQLLVCFIEFAPDLAPTLLELRFDFFAINEAGCRQRRARLRK